jgi:hypothetical protein
MKAPVVGRFAKTMAVVAVAPVVLSSVVFTALGIWNVVRGRPSNLGSVLGGVALSFIFYTLPILCAIWLGTAAGRANERKLSLRRRAMPALPPSMRSVRIMPALAPNEIPLPLFERPLADLWSKVVAVETSSQRLEVFEVVHGDLFGEAGGRLPPSRTLGPGVGLSVVSCAAIRVDADLPLVVVRPVGSKPFTLPDGMRRRTTELERFNRAFHLFSVEPYAASALVDARTIEAIHDFDRRFSVEIGGPWVLVHAPRLSAEDVQHLIDEAAGLARVFPRIAGSLYPKGRTR